MAEHQDTISDYWRSALRHYAKVSLITSSVAWAPGLVFAVGAIIWLIATGAPWRYALNAGAKGVLLAGGVGGAFFVFVLAIAVADDLRRNRGKRDRTLYWDPLLVWKVFLFGGCGMFIAFTWFSYQKEHNPILSAGFVAFAILCFVGAKLISRCS